MDSSILTYIISSLIYFSIIYVAIKFFFFKKNPTINWFFTTLIGVFYTFFFLSFVLLNNLNIIFISFAVILNIGSLFFWLKSVNNKYQINVKNINTMLEVLSNDFVSDLSFDMNEDSLANTELKQTVKYILQLKEKVSLELKKFFVLIEAIEKDTKNIQTMTLNMNSSLLSQNTSFTETSTTMRELGVTSEQTTDKARVVVDTAERSLELSQVGMHSVSESTDNMKKIRKDVENIANEIKLLKERINDISDIVIKVNNISKKTNLLALNASIEASKAGSAGKGFAVVAVEIRKLAEQAQTSVADIEVIIGKINSSAEKTVYVTEKGVRQVDDGVAQIQETGEIVKESMKSMEQNVVSAQQILAASRQQSIGIDQIADSIGQLNKGMKTIMSNSDEIKKLSNSILDTSHTN